MAPRKIASEHDRSRPVPLSEVINFGPTTLPELEACGVRTLDDLEALGLEETARRWVELFPQRLNANAMLALVATLEGVGWTQATSGQRERARRLVRDMRRELS